MKADAVNYCDNAGDHENRQDEGDHPVPRPWMIGCHGQSILPPRVLSTYPRSASVREMLDLRIAVAFTERIAVLVGMLFCYARSVFS